MFSFSGYADMTIFVRKVCRVGNSLMFSLPSYVPTPEVMYVYTNNIYMLYTTLANLDEEYTLELAGTSRSMKKRYRSKRGYRYLNLISIPKDVSTKLRISPRMRIVVLYLQLYGEPAFLAVSNVEVIEEMMLKLIQKTTRPEGL